MYDIKSILCYFLLYMLYMLYMHWVLTLLYFSIL